MKDSQVQFQPLTSQELIEILGATIKRDEENKLVTFLCQLSAYSENAQFNISFNAPSSSGKSFIPLEVSNLFPAEDVIKLGNASPTAFFHEEGVYDKEANTITVDLSRKIIIFLDQPNSMLLERLRSLLSHDQKEMQSKITDKNQKGGNRTKTVIIRGYPSVIFCSAGLRMDEQEATRFFLLSPEINQEKIREAILAKIAKESDNDSYKVRLNELPERKLLKERILAIKNEQIGEIKIANPDAIKDRFLGQFKALKPRHQRDIGKLISLIKAHALLNFWFRDKDGSTITANDEDIAAAFDIWDKVFISQELNLSPYVFKLFQEVIMTAWDERVEAMHGEIENHGLTRQDVMRKHFLVYGRTINSTSLIKDILPALESAGLIYQEPDVNDRRKMLVYPTSNNPRPLNSNYMGEGGGVSSSSDANGEGREYSPEELADMLPF